MVRRVATTVPTKNKADIRSLRDPQLAAAMAAGVARHHGAGLCSAMASVRRFVLAPGREEAMKPAPWTGECSS